jgi:hypothetical protein
VRRLLGFLVLIVALAGCHFPQGFHFPRLASIGSSTTQTLVCFQNDLAGYQGPYMAYAASLLNDHPEVAVTTRDMCPTTMNRIIWRTREVSPWWGLTNIAWSGNHLVWSDIRLDPQGVGYSGTVENSKRIVRHELCHAMGGGFGTQAQHDLCSDWRHTFADIASVYHDDPG